MKIKHWDEESQSWVIDGASNASNLELTNPSYLDNNGLPVSIDQGFTKVNNRISKLEQNLAWVYVNGAKGGGGTGGGTEETYTIEIVEGETVYTSTGAVTLNILISSGTIKRSFTVIATDMETNSVIGTWKKYSLSRTSIDLSGLEGTKIIEISAYDSNSNYATPSYITVVSGAIRLDLQKTPPKTIVRGGVSTVATIFTVTKSVNTAAEFIFKVNNLEISKVSNITTSPRTLSYDIREIIFNSGLFETVNSGQKFSFEAVATTTLNNKLLTSNIISFSVTVSEADSLIIVTDNISENSPITPEIYNDLTTYQQGSQLSFSYYLSYAPTLYSIFNVNYNVYLMSGGTKVNETPITTGLIPNINKGVNNIFVLSTVNLPLSNNEQYLMIELYGSAVSNSGDTSAQYTKQIYCRVIESTYVTLYANNDIQTLLAYFSPISGFPNNTTGTWTYNVSSSGTFPYVGSFLNSFPNGVNLTLKGVNGSTSGFLGNSDRINSIPAIVLNGESYGYLEVANQMFPNYEIGGEYSFFQSSGFNISITYKAEESSNSDEVIMGIGKYSDNELQTGFEITLEKILVKLGISGSADTIERKLPQNELLTIDLDVSLLGESAWYFKIYINGVLSAVTRVLEENIGWSFGTNLFIGCRNDNGIKSRFSSVSIYDIKLYTSSQSEFAIVQNYISATEQASLINGAIDLSLDSELRTKNLFDSTGNCLLWNRDTNSFYEGNVLYEKLVAQMSVNTPYPIVLIEETTDSPTNFKAYTTATFSAAEKEEVMSATFPVKVTFQNELGTSIISTPSGVSVENGTRVGIQGTSSLSNNEKNLELYFGDRDESGNKQLFQPIDSWLPENEFTLKADVMDSAHVNNVAIGKIINGSVKNSSGVSVKPLSATPPMLVSDSLFPNAEVAADIKSKIKHTSEGFPCLLFIKYAPDSNGIREFKFCGIYNFNLGRYAYYNLGLKLLTSYTKEKSTGPTLITDYTESTTYWNTSDNVGVSSFEINQNNSAQGAFQQDDLEIIKFMADAIYTSQDTTKAYDQFKKFYTQMANMALTTTQKYTMDDSGQLPTKEIVGEFYEYNPAYYNFATTDLHLKWDNACAYFIIGIIFGMVDSMCKNLTSRSWGSLVQYLSFYDMDTAFALNNAGQDIVEYWAHLHRWYNIQSSDSNITTYTQEKNYVSSPEVKQYYASWWSRIWEVLENLPIKDSGNVTNDRNTIEKTYVNLRTNLFPDPDKFIEDNYKSYTEKTGAIIFNYDYKIKYLRIAQTYDKNTGIYTDSTDFSQLKYLHGNRVIRVKDWFKKRIMFLDGIYGITNNVVNLGTIDSPITNSWLNNKATGSNTTTKINLEMSSTSKILYRWTYDKTIGSFWLDKDSTSCTVPIPAGETIVTMYANTYITKFNNFKGYPWTALTTIDFPLLEELDLSGLSNIPANTFFSGGVYDSVNNTGLKNIKKLNLSGVRLLGSSYTLNVANCNKLQNLDISYSNISTVTLPSSAILKSYNLSGTNITNLILNNQSFLSSLQITDCNSLTRIELNNCNSLTALDIPSNVTTLIIKNCNSLDTLDLSYSSINNSISPLVSVIIDNCPGLKTFITSGQNNPNLNINLVGAWNLENLNLSDTITSNILLPSLFVDGNPNFYSLKSLNISRTNISNLVFNDKDENNNTIIYNYLNLLEFKDLDNISAQNCSSLTKVICANNINNPIDLNSYSFFGCSELTRIIGNFRINGLEVFKGCSKLILNDPIVYLNHSASEFLYGSDVTNISFSNSLNSLYRCFEGCSSLIYDDFKRLMLRIGDTVTSLEATFKGCTKINNELWRDIFSNCRNITSLKETFSGCKLTGKFYSRSSNYSYADESTWGILDYLPNLRDTESAFESTNLEWIDNNIFSKKLINDQEIYPSLVKIDHMFRNCRLLKSCNDTRSLIPTRALLNSETFFIDLRNLIAIYPDGIFSGCISIDMDIINDSNGNTLLFHKLDRPINSVSITDSIYSGINLIGEIKNNVFGGINQNISDKYYIPVITSIQSPFSLSGSRINVNMSEMGSVFRSINSILLQAISPFSGVNCIGSKVIPDDIFQGCNVLNNIESFFSGLNLDNDSQIYEFPNSNLFKDCYNLGIVRGLFTNCNKLKIKLLGDGFINCQLTDVSGMFLNSGVFGTIPYHLFFMKKDNLNGTKSLVKTITNMSNIFKGCWCLGYQNREINLDAVLDNIIDSDGNIVPICSTWSDHLVKTEGTPVKFKLDVSQMTKTWNYDRDENYEITNPAYISDINSRPLDYDINTPETIINPDYNPGELAYDIWYIDGYGWENSNTIDIEESGDLNSLENQKARLTSKYFIYDEQQKQSIIDNTKTGWSVVSHQNYMIPADLFRYCSSTINLSNVLSDLNWYKNEVIIDELSGKYKVNKTNVLEGLFGRIPCKIFNSLTNSTSLTGAFKNTNFDPFVGLRGTNTQLLIRGISYPVDLFKYNTKLLDVSEMFFNTKIPVGVDINSDLFIKLSELKIVSNLWSNCGFDNRAYNAQGTKTIYPQINYSKIFEFNTKITNASGLFAAWDSTSDNKGLLLIESSLLENALYINDVSNMFYSCTNLKGSVPLFNSLTYTALNITGGYLYGVLESNIINANSVQQKLRPSDWTII